jgi:iron complex transport system ATP-binding protein
MTQDVAPLLALRNVRLVRDERTILDAITWALRPGERWVVLGQNGSGKTTLMRIASLYVHPSSGDVDVLGERLGRFDVRRMRTRIGLASSLLAAQFRRELTPLEIVMTAKNAALEPWWHTYTADDRSRALGFLERLGVGAYADRSFGTLSSGEQQRVQLARTLMADPAFVLLDEPTAGLDLTGRETLVSTLSDLAHQPASPPFVLVTHHVDEIPPGFTHVLLLAGGCSLAQGSIDDVLTADSLSACFGIDLELERRADGRFSAWAHRR